MTLRLYTLDQSKIPAPHLQSRNSRLHLDMHRQVPIPTQSLLHQWECLSNTIAQNPWKVMPQSPERHFLIPPLYLGLACFHLLCSSGSFQLPETGSASLPSKEYERWQQSGPIFLWLKAISSPRNTYLILQIAEKMPIKFKDHCYKPQINLLSCEVVTLLITTMAMHCHFTFLTNYSATNYKTI